MKGIGKGFIGFITKPIGGTIMFITKTARGILRTPRTIYNKLLK